MNKNTKGLTMRTTTAHRPNRTSLAAALSISVLLAACGGGGSDSAPVAAASGGGTASPTATASPPAPQAAVFPTAAALQEQAYGRILQLQKAAGITLVPQVPQGINPALNRSVKNHLNYMLTNKAFTSTEDMSLPGATGRGVYYQAQAAGYPVTERNLNGQQFAPIPPGVTGDQWIEAILSTGTGASFLLLDGEFGFAFAPYPNATNPIAMAGLVIGGTVPNDFRNGTTNKQPMYIYPYNGQTNVPPTNLVPDFALFTPAAAGTHGTPISFLAGGNAFVSIQSATLTDPSGNSIPLTLCGATIDPRTGLPNGGMLGNTPTPACEYGKGIAVPQTPLKPNTAYTFTYKVETGQVPKPGEVLFTYVLSGTTTFTTGSQTPFNPNQLF